MPHRCFLGIYFVESKRPTEDIDFEYSGTINEAVSTTLHFGQNILTVDVLNISDVPTGRHGVFVHRNRGHLPK